jgi:hypothetical protein
MNEMYDKNSQFNRKVKKIFAAETYEECWQLCSELLKIEKKVYVEFDEKIGKFVTKELTE